MVNKDLTTLFTGRRLIVFEELDSTNTYLSELVKAQTLPEGTSVRSYSQKSGRGQSGARWVSEAGKNLLVSFLFFPNFIPPRKVHLLNKTYALGVYDFIRTEFEKSIRIKWPNDIYCNDKKLGGLLVENSMTSTTINHSILGVGLNINQTEFPPGIPNPVSFAMIKPGNYNLDVLFSKLCSKLEARYLQLKRGDHDTIEKEYHQALYRLDEWCFYEDSDGKFPGCIKGVDEHGKLMVEDEEGEIRVYDLKEIRFMK